MEKACTKCGDIKPLDRFSFDKRTRDGRQSWCRECVRASIAAYRATPRGRKACREASHRHEAKPSTKKRRQAYRRSPKAKAAAADYVARNRDKRAAKNAVNSAVARGDMPPAKDCACADRDDSCFGPVEYHHDSYLESDWLVVRPLCRSHHQRWHVNNVAKRSATPTLSRQSHEQTPADTRKRSRSQAK